MRRSLLVAVFLFFAVSARAQKPMLFDVSRVLVGAKRIPTLYFLADGRWSDAGDHVGLLSTEIKCYKAFGFCDVANAHWVISQAGVTLRTFEIIRWDNTEIIAVDNSPACVTETLRADLNAKRVSLSSTDTCKVTHKIPTAKLLGGEDAFRNHAEHSKQVK